MRLLDGINDIEDELYTFDSIIESKTTSTGLEELKRIKNYKELTYVADITGFERVNRKLAYNDELKVSFATIEKELKTLNFILENTIIKLGFDREEGAYYVEINGGKIICTNEEYNLLKERLL